MSARLTAKSGRITRVSGAAALVLAVFASSAVLLGIYRFLITVKLLELQDTRSAPKS